VLTTKTKVSLAALAYSLISLGRRIVGKDDCTTVHRRGIQWSLNLSEGIDFSIYLLGAFERGTVATLQKLVKPGDVVFDIGANIGSHTLGLAHRVGDKGKVYAFEPTDFAFEKLRRNIALNPRLQARICARQILLTSTVIECPKPELYASWPLKNNGAVHPKHRGRLATTQNATVDTVDAFVEHQGIDRVNLMKIDVDGHELPVLQGSLGVLTVFKPVLVMEMSPYIHAEQNSSFSGLIALFRDAGYSIQHAGTRKPLPLQAGALEALIPDGAGINVIARPN